MNNKFIKSVVFAASTLLATASGSLFAQEAQTLDQLLGFVKQGQTTEAKENRAREARFKSAKDGQAKLLRDAEKMRTQEEQRSTRLEANFEVNEQTIADKQKQLKDRLGTLTELFGHLTSAAGDLRSNFGTSLVSAQYPNREVFFDELIGKMSGSDQLPSIEEIERMWFEMQREMTESGRVVKFTTTISKPGGEKEEREVIRIGSYNIVTDEGNYLTFNDNGILEVLARQPTSNFIGWASALANSTSGYSAFGADPTGPLGGSYLAALINTPTMGERFEQGGAIGKAIAAVGAFAFVLAIWRLLALTSVYAKVNAQLKNDKANPNNPLGRVLMVHEENPSMDTETLELKLSEAVLKETPKIEYGLNMLKIIAAVAPLMGLLGTVTNMILVFQAIVIFGAGDPTAMAGGISGALVTTVLGLLVAIPTVLLHTVTSGQAKKVLHVLDEQTTGIIAEHTEAKLGKS